MRLSGLFGPGDDVVDKDEITVYDSIVLDEGAVGSRTDLSVLNTLMASDDFHADCTAVEAPSQSSAGYVDIQLKPQQ